jgi:hypothetical protein
MEKLIIDKKLTDKLLKWILVEENRENYLRESNTPKYFASRSIFVEDKPMIDAMGLNFDDLVKVDKQILVHYGLHPNTPLDDEFGYLISWHTKGKEVTPHRDCNKKGKINVRFNLLLKKSKKGGIPFINGDEIKTELNEVYVLLAGVNLHGTTLVESDDDRVLLSMGHYIDEEIVKEKGWMHADCKPNEETPMWGRGSIYDEDKYYPYVNLAGKEGLRNFTVEDEAEFQIAYLKKLTEFFDESTPEAEKISIAKQLSIEYIPTIKE